MAPRGAPVREVRTMGVVLGERFDWWETYIELIVVISSMIHWISNHLITIYPYHKLLSPHHHSLPPPPFPIIPAFFPSLPLPNL